MDFYLYMGLEVGGCSLFADPSGYVGRKPTDSTTLIGLHRIEDGANAITEEHRAGRYR